MAKLVIEMMEIPQPLVLSLDRTEWQFGSKIFNILTQPAVAGSRVINDVIPTATNIIGFFLEESVCGSVIIRDVRATKLLFPN